jgi:hypothetical protein
MPERAFEHQRDAEGQQQPVEMVQVVEALEQRLLEQHAQPADDDRRQHQRHPEVDLELRAQQQRQLREPDPRQERGHHELRAMREVDDVEQAEDDRQAHAQHGVEAAVDQAHQQLGQPGPASRCRT